MSLDQEQQARVLSKERLRFWLKLLKSQTIIETEIRRRLREEFAMTLPRFDVMSVLARFPDGLKMSEISALLKVSNGNVTGIVDRLAEDGLALRLAVSGDRRAHSVRLTAAGAALFERLAHAHELWLNDILQPLDHQELHQTAIVLERLNTALEEAKNDQ